MSSFEEQWLRTAEEALGEIDNGWRAAGSQLSRAMSETALELGGESFAQEVASLAENEGGILPNVAAYKKIQDTYQDGGELVLQRFREIRHTDIAEERAESRRHPMRWLGSRAIEGIELLAAGFYDLTDGMSNLNPYRKPRR